MKSKLKLLSLSLIFLGISVSLSVVPGLATSLSPSSSWIDNNFTKSSGDLVYPYTPSISSIEYWTMKSSTSDYWAQVGINTLLGGTSVYVSGGSKISLTLKWTITGETYAGSNAAGTSHTENDFAAIICSASSNCLSTNSVSEPHEPSISHLSINTAKLIDTAYWTPYINYVVSVTTTYTPSSGTWVSFASYIWSYGGGNGAIWHSEFTQSWSGNIGATVCNSHYCHVALSSVSYSIVSGNIF